MSLREFVQYGHASIAEEVEKNTLVASLLFQISVQHVSVLHCSTLSLAIITNSLVSGV